MILATGADRRRISRPREFMFPPYLKRPDSSWTTESITCLALIKLQLKSGRRGGSRTHTLTLIKRLLYQLSYTPVRSRNFDGHIKCCFW